MTNKDLRELLNALQEAVQIVNRFANSVAIPVPAPPEPNPELVCYPKPGNPPDWKLNYIFLKKQYDELISKYYAESVKVETAQLEVKKLNKCIYNAIEHMNNFDDGQVVYDFRTEKKETLSAVLKTIANLLRSSGGDDD